MTVTHIKALEASTPESGRPLGWWAMVTFITTEAVLFAGLIFVYFYLQASSPNWPPQGVPKPELLVSALRSLLLLGSSIPIMVAERALKAGRKSLSFAMFGLTFIMASVFMAGHVLEQFKLIAEFTFRSHAYGSAFYTIVNFHALHLTIGMAMIAFVMVGIARNKFDRHRELPVRNVGMYWHFVDAVWVVVYLTLYVSPHMFGGGN